MFYALNEHFKPLKCLNILEHIKDNAAACLWMSTLHGEALERSSHHHVGLFFKHRPSQVRQPSLETQNGGAFQLEDLLVVYQRNDNLFRAVPVLFTLQHKPQEVDGYMLFFTPSIWPDVAYAKDSSGEKLYPEIVTRRLDPNKVEQALQKAADALKQDIETVLGRFETLPPIPAQMPDTISRHTLLPAYFNDRTFALETDAPEGLKDDLTRITRLFMTTSFYQGGPVHCTLSGRTIGQWGRFTPLEIDVVHRYHKHSLPSHINTNQLLQDHRSFLNSKFQLRFLKLKSEELTAVPTRHTQMKDMAWLSAKGLTLHELFPID